MLSRFTEDENTYTVWDELRRRLDRVWDEYETSGADIGVSTQARWPRVNVFDAAEGAEDRGEGELSAARQATATCSCGRGFRSSAAALSFTLTSRDTPDSCIVTP